MVVLWVFGEDEWDSIEDECEVEWSGGINGAFNWDVTERKDNLWGDEGLENDTCEVGLWKIDFNWKSEMEAIAEDRRMTDIYEGTVVPVKRFKYLWRWRWNCTWP